MGSSASFDAVRRCALHGVWLEAARTLGVHHGHHDMRLGLSNGEGDRIAIEAKDEDGDDNDVEDSDTVLSQANPSLAAGALLRILS
jgi:hypothetical protein